MRMILGAAAAVILSVGVGYGGGLILKESLETVAPARPGADTHGSARADGIAERKEHRIEIGRVMVPVHRPNAITYVVADLIVVLRDDRAAERAKRRIPRIKAVVIDAMTHWAAEGNFSKETIDGPALSAFLAREIDAAIGEGATADVLLDSLLRQDVAR